MFLTLGRWRAVGAVVNHEAAPGPHGHALQNDRGGEAALSLGWSNRIPTRIALTIDPSGPCNRSRAIAARCCYPCLCRRSALELTHSSGPGRAGPGRHTLARLGWAKSELHCRRARWADVLAYSNEFWHFGIFHFGNFGRYLKNESLLEGGPAKL